MDLLFLHGVAAAGKLTVARELSARLHVGVFHNHLVVDALTAVFPFGTPAFVELRERFWLDTFGVAAASGVSLVFTFAPEPTVGAGFAERVVATVTGAGGRVRFVELTVGGAEQERRIGLASRHEFAKLTSVDTLRRLRADAGRRDHPPTDHPPTDLRIDTERLSPPAAAEQVIAHFALRAVAPWSRYPDQTLDPPGRSG